MKAELLIYLQSKVDDFPLRAIPLSGGDINDVYLLKGEKDNYVVKVNDKKKYPGIFEKEAKGLQLLSENKLLTIPKVINVGSFKDDAFLILEYLEPELQSEDFWVKFGTGLANLHAISSSKFGLDHSNYIGSLPQINDEKETWVDFFVLNRLEPQLEMAINGGLGKSLYSKFQNFFSKIESIFPIEKPALLHGDLWSGNFLKGKKGEPGLIDPAVYFGHREMDIAMTKLFGGFSNQMYEAYNEYYPLEKGWQERVDFCNLYPLMVHVNLFGEGYVSQVSSILNRF